MHGTGTGQDATIPERFRRIVAAYADRIALVSDDHSLTYGALDRAANRIANTLQQNPGGGVAMLMQQDAPQCIALLAAAKCGRMAVFLNPDDPPARLSQILTDAEPAVILTDRTNQELALALAGEAAVLLFEDCNTSAETNIKARISPDDCAVLVYTSGSTGQPKAVMVPHRQLIHTASGLAHAMQIVPEDRLPLLGALTGLQAVNVACLAWLHGAALHPFPTGAQGVTGLAGWIAAREITAYVSSASLFRNLLKTVDQPEAFSSLRIVRLGSESASAEDFRNFQAYFRNATHFVHALSSSETGLMAYHRIHRDETLKDGRIPIGHPAAGHEITLIDETGAPVAPGLPGEIVVKSPYLSTGYWKDEARTQERFQIAPATGLTVYRTGDIARWSEDGLLEFSGRQGNRINIRGYRIEPREVEDAIRQIAAVEGVVVSAWEKPNEDTELAAHIVLRAGHAASTSALRRASRAVLPRHMIPSTIILLDHFPLTGHGKIDRARLPREAPPGQAAPYEAPATEQERYLASLWAKTLEAPRIGRNDDFFDLGGDSLLAAAIAAQIHAGHGIILTLDIIFDHPILKDFAAAITAQIATAAPSLPPPAPIPRGGALPLSFEEEWIWRASQTPQQIADYTAAALYEGKGPLNISIFEQCLTYLAQRHEILRTGYQSQNGQPVALIQPPAPVPLAVFHADPAHDIAAQLASFITRGTACMRDLAQAFDLAKPPLYRFSLFVSGPEEFHLLLVSHHIFYDSPSWAIYFRELPQLYAARAQNQSFPLPATQALQYADISSWRRDAWHRDTAERQQLADWWAAHLAGAPQHLDLPFAYPRPSLFRRKRPAAAPETGTQSWRLDPKDSGRLAMLGHAAAGTPFILRLAVFLALLHDETKMPDLVIGSYTTQRGQIPGGDAMLGFFANMTMLRSRIQPGLSLMAWIDTVRMNVFAAMAHSRLSTDLLIQELRAARLPVPAVTVIFSDHLPRIDLNFAGISLRHAERVVTRMPWSFSIGFEDYHGAQECRTTFDANRFNPQSVSAFLDRYRRLLIAAPDMKDAPLAECLAKI